MSEQAKDRLCFLTREFAKPGRSYEQKLDYLTGALDTLESIGVSMEVYDEMELRIENILWPEGMKQAVTLP